MQPEVFLDSIQAPEPPTGLSPYLQALWWEKKGYWDKAHELVQDLPDQLASAIHAYLHRREGDLWNARYWYSRASTPEFTGTAQAEWHQLVIRALK